MLAPATVDVPMSSYTPSPPFEEAASYLSTASSPSKVSTAVKLELYGLFKLLTVSPTPNTSRPSLFDMTGRAKWDAWAHASMDYDSRLPDAEKKYLEIARSLGWKEGQVPDDDDSTSSSDEGGGGGAGLGMGLSVSSMAPPPPEEDGASELHNLAVRDDAAALSVFLQSNPGTDVNAKDEFGYTALHLASDRGNLSIVEVLLQNGADKSQKDEDDYTAVELAKIADHDEVVALLES